MTVSRIGDRVASTSIASFGLQCCNVEHEVDMLQSRPERMILLFAVKAHSAASVAGLSDKTDRVKNINEERETCR